MWHKHHLVCVLLVFFFGFFYAETSNAKVCQRVNARSAILIDMENGAVLYEQNADAPIPPASITKILSLYLVFEAIKEGQVQLTDKVEVSRRAANTGGSRMGLRAGTRVPLEELIKGMAVVSGNDACVAVAEHISGSVERWVRQMNAKAQELGMTNTRFMTPNGLPAPGQFTTARDISKLSIAYLRRYPESLAIHSMQAYTYGRNSHHNANRLLGRCPGVDGIKTGFVCAAGYNISATAKRGGVRILAVVMGARNAWIRLTETEKLLEAGFRECGCPHADVKYASSPEPVKEAQPAVRAAKVSKKAVVHKIRVSRAGRHSARVASVRVKSVPAGKAAVKEDRKAGKLSASRTVTADKKHTRAVAKKERTVRQAVAGTKCAGAKSVQAKAAKNSKAEKIIKSSKKHQSSTASARKKTSSVKPASHAEAMKKTKGS